MRKTFAIALLAVLGTSGAFSFAGFPIAQATAQTVDADHKVTIWRDPGCGCCDTYAEYLRTHGYDVTLVDDPDFARRSVEVGVPEQGLGCHLAEVDGYYVSGLVPVEIIERLVSERPDIVGVTLPGMPSNAPGMASEKSGTLRIYAFAKDGVALYSDE